VENSLSKTKSEIAIASGSAADVLGQMPEALLALMERRYLSPLEAVRWEIGLPSVDAHRPLLREVVGLGRPEAQEWGKMMPNLLSACAEPGHAFVMAVHGNGGRHRLYLGGRRLGGARSTEDYLQGQESALRACFTGLKLGGESLPFDRVGIPEMAWLAESAPALGVVTGIASGRGPDGELGENQSLDRLIEAAGNHNYVLLVVAEPVDAREIDATADRLRRLKSAIHSFVRRSMNEGASRTDGTSRTEVPEKSAASLLPLLFFGMGAFLNLAVGPVGQTMTSLGFGVSAWAAREDAKRNRQVSTSVTETSGVTIDYLDANAEFCERLLDRYLERLQAARAGGWWQTGVYIAAESEAGLMAVGAAIRSTCSGKSSGLDPIRLHILPSHLLRPAMLAGRVLSMKTGGGKDGAAHPFGPAFERLGTCLDSNELSALVNLPAREVAGVPMRDRARFALSAPAPVATEISLGSLLNTSGDPIETLTISQATLNRHVFVTGMTGYGKTNTCMSILMETWRRNGLPFLVIEPAKAEYRRLADLPEMRGKLRVFSVGGGDGLPLRLNPLSPLPGIPLGRHIDLLKAVFNASFPMFAGMAYVLEEAILDVYTDRGWSLFDSDNAFLRGKPEGFLRAALIPNLEDLHGQIDVVMGRKRYAQEINQNMSAALHSRLRSLLVGNKGLMLNCRRSISPDVLFSSPSVIELQNMGDDEEKAFVMALLFVFLYEFAEVRQRRVGPSRLGTLQHLTLIEEAHRLLKAVAPPAAQEMGDPRGKAVTMFTDMLAEMRAYGEGFIIADQSPTKLVSDTLKNTNLKIVHRLNHPDDRQAAGGCTNLDEKQMRQLNNLSPGQAVVHDERIGEAVLVQIHPFKEAVESSVERGLSADTSLWDKSYLHRNAGCHACDAPCDYLPSLLGSTFFRESQQDFLALFEAVLFDDMAEAGLIWRRLEDGLNGAEPKIGKHGLFVCALIQSLEKWLGDLLDVSSGCVLEPAARLEREIALLHAGPLIAKLGATSPEDGPQPWNQLRALFQNTVATVEDATGKVSPGDMEAHLARRYILPYLHDSQKPITNKLLGSLRDDPVSVLNAIASIAVSRLEILRRHAEDGMVRRSVLCSLIAALDLPRAAIERRDALLEALRTQQCPSVSSLV